MEPKLTAHINLSVSLHNPGSMNGPLTVYAEHREDVSMNFQKLTELIERFSVAVFTPDTTTATP